MWHMMKTSPLNNVTSSQLKFWTKPSLRERFKMTLVESGFVQPPDGIYVIGLDQQLTSVNMKDIKPLELDISEKLNARCEKSRRKIAKALSEYLTKNPGHVVVVDSNYDYIDAILYLPHSLFERVHIIEYKPVVMPAPAWVQLVAGGVS